MNNKYPILNIKCKRRVSLLFNIHHLIFIISFFAFTLKSSAQTYPVQTFVQVSPPHTSYLPDYSDPFSNQMKIFLTLTDFTVPSYQVKLRFTFTGNGYSITTSSLLNLPTTTLSPGTPVEISGNDLAPYLSSQNLVFSGIDVADYESRKILPEGPCQICVEVVDFSNPNQSVLSNPACTQVWFSLNDPPLLNTPFCGNQIIPTDPQQVIFSWTPLHMNSLHSAGTQYIFELFEIRPEGADPNQVVNSTLPVFMQVTDQTFINYGITEPQLQIGMSYAWRVRAQDIQGRDFFRNNGYGSVCTFTYGNVAASLADGITLTLNSTGTGTRMGYAWWNVSSTFTHYKLEVRKTGNPDYAWFPYESTSGELKIYQLEPSTQYECRVKGLIGTEYESEWSNTSVFTTQPTPDYSCGSTTLPPGEINFTPLTNAIAGLTFTVGQFEMLVTDIEPINPITQPGHYRGTGKIAVGFAIVNLRVKFDDILVDDNLLVRSGKVEAITQGIDAWLNEQNTPQPDYYVDGTITDFAWNDSTSLTVWVDGQPQNFSFADHDPIIIQDEEGMIYTFNSDGTYTVFSTLIYSQDVLAGNSDYRIDFSKDPDQVYGFDKKEYAAWIHDYEVIRLTDSTNYFVSYKSLAPSETDYVIANIKSAQPLTGVSFIAVNSGVTTNLTAQSINDSTYRITLSNLDASCFVYAVHEGNRIGKLWVKVLPQIQKEIVLVPVNGATLLQIAETQNQLNAIYKQANVTFTVTTKSNYQSTSWDLNGDGKLQTGDVDLMSHYSEEMRLLRDEYFAADTSYNKNAYHIFIIPEFLATDLSGYMVRGKGVGFLKNGETSRTAAHELAHGIFALEHTFPDIAQGTTDNLLDYTSAPLSAGTNGTHLAQKQWYRIHEPLPAFSMFDGEEEGESISMGLNADSDLLELGNGDGTYTFFTPAGKPITIKGEISQIQFSTFEDKWYKSKSHDVVNDSYFPVGSLQAFKVDNHVYTGKKSGNNFLGYYSSELKKYYEDTLTAINPDYTPIIVAPAFGKTNGFHISAVRSNVNVSSFNNINSSNQGEGAVAGINSLVGYFDPDSIKSNLTFSGNFSFNPSDAVVATLGSMLFDDSYGSQMGSSVVNHHVFEDVYFYSNSAILPFANAPATQPITFDVFYGAYALEVYRAAYTIDQNEDMLACIPFFNESVSQKIYEAIFSSIILAQQNVQSDLDLGTDNSDNQLLYLPIAEEDQSLYATSVEQLVNAPAIDGFTQAEINSYKKDRIKALYATINFLFDMAKEIDEINNSNDEISSDNFIAFMDYAAEKEPSMLNCIYSRLSLEKKIEIIEKAGTSGSISNDNKEELIVRVFENLTPSEFNIVYTHLKNNDCDLLHRLYSDIWFGQWDRLAGSLTHHLIAKAYNEGIDFASLKTITIVHDGIAPIIEGEVETTFDGCEIEFDAQLFGFNNNQNITAPFNELIKFVVDDDFSYTGPNGEQLNVGDTIIAPAFWGYYFLLEEGDNTNSIIGRVIAEAIIILATMETAAPLVIALESTLTAADFTISWIQNENPNNEIINQVASAFNALVTLVYLPQMIQGALQLGVWISKQVIEGGIHVYKIVKSELKLFVQELKSTGHSLLEIAQKVREIYLSLKNMPGSFERTMLMNYLDDVNIQLRLAEKSNNHAVNQLTVIGKEIRIESVSGPNFPTTLAYFDSYSNTGEVILKSSDMSLYDEALHGAVGQDGVLMRVDNVLVKHSSGIKTESFEVVETVGGSKYFRLVGGAGSLAQSLTGFLKSSYDDLLLKGFNAVEEAGKIKFLDNSGRYLAEISNGKLIFKYGGFGGDIVITEGKVTTVLGKFAEDWANPNSNGTRYFLGSDANPVVNGFPSGSINRGMGQATPNRLNFLDLPEAQYNTLINDNIKSELETFLGSSTNVNLASNSIDDVKSLIKSSHPDLTTTQIDNIVTSGQFNGNNAFWDNYNLPFLEQAFQRGDDIRLVSDPAIYQPNAALGGTYKKELDAIMGDNGLAQQYGYTYNSTTKTFVKQ